MDGLRPAEQDLLERFADYFGVDLNELAKALGDLSALPWATRVLVYGDAVTLALVDGMSGAEELHLADLVARMAMPAETASAVSAWVSDYDALLRRRCWVSLPPGQHSSAVPGWRRRVACRPGRGRTGSAG